MDAPAAGFGVGIEVVGLAGFGVGNGVLVGLAVNLPTAGCAVVGLGVGWNVLVGPTVNEVGFNVGLEVGFAVVLGVGG